MATLVASNPFVPVDRTVSSENNLIVKVPKKPLGGNRGLIGTVVIKHSELKSITDFTDQDLYDLNLLIEKVLLIHKGNGIKNTLIFAKEEPGKSIKFHIIPYPTCGMREKLQGLYHVIFGASPLPQNVLGSVAGFYRQQWEVYQELQAPLKSVAGSDFFCNDEVIQRQLVEKVEKEGRQYLILQDYRPLGDPHLLIIPPGEQGHQDPFVSCSEMRLDVLGIVRAKMAKIKQEDRNKTVFYTERLGNLRSVNHFHAHVFGSREPLETFWQKISSCFKVLFPSRLSQEQLRSAVDKEKQD